MANIRSSRLSNSPRSPNDIDSHHPTPETNSTAFTPEDCSVGTKATSASIKVNLPPAFVIDGVSLNQDLNPNGIDATSFDLQDPFVTNSSNFSGPRNTVNGPKLSAMAASFIPQGHLGTFSNSSSSFAHPSIAIPDVKQNSGTSAVSYLAATSVPDDRYADVGLNGQQLSPIGPPTPSSSTSSDTTRGSSTAGHFSTDGGFTRTLMIGNVSKTITSPELNGMFNTRTYNTLNDIGTADLVSKGVVYLNFSDIRDASKASWIVKTIRADWTAQHIPTKDVVFNSQSRDFARTSLYEGQILVKASFAGSLAQFDPTSITHSIKELLQNYGELLAYEHCVEPPDVFYRAEYYDGLAADHAYAVLDQFKFAGCTVEVQHYRPDFDEVPAAKAPGPVIVGRDEAFLSTPLARLSIANVKTPDERDSSLFEPTPSGSCTSPMSRQLTAHGDLNGYSLPSISGQFIQGHLNCNVQEQVYAEIPYYAHQGYGLQMPQWPLCGLGAVGQERNEALLPRHRSGGSHQHYRGSTRAQGRHNHDYGSVHHNVVDVERIRRGLDVRTTIMLRNIPNKINQEMLKKIVDETSHGKFDFMYLRIDFANNCNVGYAFINFEDPYFIIDFVNARAGRRWNCYNSDKVAEVSYATIQGKDCLVSKFRNSSVMLESPSFRPKIFHTGSGPLAGTEDKFPSSDNLSKMRRSIENAEHVGLFAPRAGQHFRDEQRRRRSQYDRGTRLAEMEDSYELDGNSHYITSHHLHASDAGHSQGIFRRGRKLVC